MSSLRKSNFKGKKHSIFTRLDVAAKLSGRKRKPHTPQTIEKIKAARAKQIMRPEDNLRRSLKQRGRKFSEESLKKMSEHAYKRFSVKENNTNYGKHWNEDFKKKLSQKFKGKKIHEIVGEERAIEIIKKVKLARSKQIFPKKDSSIELKIQGFLNQLNIPFQKHRQLTKDHPYQSDIFIPSLNLVIECDGKYWHGHPDTFQYYRSLNNKIKICMILDYLRTAELNNLGYNVIRLWEDEIKLMNLETFQSRLSNMNQEILAQ